MLKIVQRSDTKEKFGVNIVPHGPGAGVVNYALGVCGVLMEGMLVQISKGAHLIGNLKL